MTGFSDYLEDKILNMVLKNTGTLSASAPYVELSVQDPTDAGTGGTTKTNRVSVTFGSLSGGSCSNSGSVTFSVSTDGTYAYCSVWDASSSGNMLYSGALTTPRAALNGDTLTFAAGQLTATNT